MSSSTPMLERVRGCLLGGAAGDAQHSGHITDATQLTLFTTEGLIRAAVRWTLRGICHPPSVVDHAYARWLQTQGEHSGRWNTATLDGWLIGIEGLHERRDPGPTSLASLAAPRAGTIDHPLNDSKGCGGVMRVAPAGLRPSTPADAFALGCDLAAITHGHPSGYLAAGALALIVHDVAFEDAPLASAVERARARVQRHPDGTEVDDALAAADSLARSGATPSRENVERLGEGWVAEEALAIAVYCALVGEDFQDAIELAGDHGGNADTTAAITGNILGARDGVGAIPTDWLGSLDARYEIEQLSRDWQTVVVERSADLEADRTWWQRYPGW